MKFALYSLAALCLCLPMAQAADSKATPRPTPKHVTIKAISSSEITINTGVVTKTYKLDDRTVYVYQGVRVPQSDIKTGMRVNVTPSFDGKNATMVTATEGPQATPAPSAAAPKVAPKATPATTPKK
ncbi:MAG: hypothetical protein ACFUZC_01545 [Chthoniobacteraceae bacterium]